MSFMTMLAGSLLAGFAVGGFVWLTWSIVERVLARKAAPAVEPKVADAAKDKADAKARAK
ncbi:MAG: hypothetical protein AMXMBFR82_24640 [Candidatus Hydrogenedentota bacterium]